MGGNNNANDCPNDRRARKTVPPDQIDKLGYCSHPGGDVNPYETPSRLTEYQLK